MCVYKCVICKVDGWCHPDAFNLLYSQLDDSHSLVVRESGVWFGLVWFGLVWVGLKTHSMSAQTYIIIIIIIFFDASWSLSWPRKALL
jgi:hypothetical protein